MRLGMVALAMVQMAAAGDFALDLLPADTRVVFGIRVRSITESPIFKDVGADAQKLGDDWLKLVAIAGFDPLHDIDEVMLASSADRENAPALLVVRGRFDLARMGAGAARYHGVALVGADTAGKSVIALLDASTALAGEAPAVRAAIDRHERGAATDAALATRVQSLRDRFDVWGTGERAEGFVPPTGKGEAFDAIDRFEFGVRISKGLELGAEIHTRSVKDAEKLVAMIEAVQTMASAQTPAAPKIDVRSKDGTVKISFAISEEDLKKAMAAGRAASAPRRTVPVVVGSEPAMPAPTGQSQSGGTSVFVLPGKK